MQTRASSSGARHNAGWHQHHLHHALDVAVGRFQATDVYAQPPGDGGANLFGIQPLAFNLAGPDDVLGESLQLGL
jgi:hypothetical protein